MFERYHLIPFELPGLSGTFEKLSDTLFVRSSPVLHYQDFVLSHMRKDSCLELEPFDSLLFVCTLSGTGLITAGGQSYPLTAGQAMLADCRKPLAARSVSPDWEHFLVRMWGSAAESICGQSLPDGLLIAPVPVMEIVSIADGLLDACMTISEYDSLYVSTALLNLISMFFRHFERSIRPTIPDTYRYMIRYMESNYTRALTLDELSEFANVSKYHFSREFRKYTGFSPLDYLIELRIRHACFLLKSTARSIEQIASDVGVRNMANFIQLFKKRTGMTPRAYRGTDYPTMGF